MRERNPGRWRAFAAVLTLAWAATNATTAAAEPKGEHGPKEHPKSAPAGQHDEHAERDPGRGHPDMREVHGQAHEHEHAADAGVTHGVGDAMRRRLDELQAKGDKLTPEEQQELERLRAHGHRVPWAQRKARYAELKAKLDAGRLSGIEQSEFDKLQKFEAKHEALEAREKSDDETRKKRSREAKRDALRQNPSVGKDAATTAEFRKHAERVAKLERAQALATTEDDNDMIQKIQSLLGKEQMRHGAWLAKHAPNKAGAAQ